MKGMDFMRLEQLQYIVAIAEYKSFSKASNTLFLSPQALSRSMLSLEKELGITLFIRFATGVELTQDGKLVVDMAKKMLSEYETTMNQIWNRTKPKENVVYLYAHNVYTAAYLNYLVLKYKKMEPNIRIIIQEFDGSMVEKIEKGKDNWCVFTVKCDMESLLLEKEILSNVQYTTDDGLPSRYVVCVSNRNVLAQQKEVSLKMLAKMPFVRFAVEINEDDEVHDFIRSYYKGQTIQSGHTVNTLSAWLDAISEDMGIGLIDKIVCGKYSKVRAWFEKVVVLPVTDPIHLKHVFVTSRDCSEEIMNFIEFALQELKKML